MKYIQNVKYRKMQQLGPIYYHFDCDIPENSADLCLFGAFIVRQPAVQGLPRVCRAQVSSPDVTREGRHHHGNARRAEVAVLGSKILRFWVNVPWLLRVHSLTFCSIKVCFLCY